MGCQITLARGRQRVYGFMPYQGLQCVAKAAPITIVDDQCRATVGGNTVRYGVHVTCKRGAVFDQIAVDSIIQPIAQRGLR